MESGEGEGFRSREPWRAIGTARVKRGEMGGWKDSENPIPLPHSHPE